MAVLWAAEHDRTVAQVRDELAGERDLAYTTVMTVLDRLAKKGLVVRHRAERAWSYRPALAQHMYLARELAAVLEGVPEPVRLRALQEFIAVLRAQGCPAPELGA